MLKRWFYQQFSKYCTPFNPFPVLKLVSGFLEKYLGYAVFNYGGIKLTAAPNALLDWYIIQGININPHLTSALSQCLSDGGVFLDIGANHGVFSLLAARNPKTQVFAFEPSPRELSRLWKNLFLNNKPNISVLSYGLSEQYGYQPLTLHSADNPGKNSLPVINNQGKQALCAFAPIGELLSPDILRRTKVCKIDIEGQEVFVLNSLKPYVDLIKQTVFVIEMSPLYLQKVNHTVDDIYHFFESIGFKYQYGKSYLHTQWEEFFYHPDYSQPLIYSEVI